MISHILAWFEFWHILLSISLVSLVLSWGLISLFSHLFRRWDIMDRPQKYGHDRAPVPFSLGFVLYLNFLLCSLLFLELTPKLVLILVLAWVVTTISFIDDLATIDRGYALHPLIRMAMQACIGGIIGLTSIKIGYVSNIFGGITDLTFWSTTLGNITIYWIPLIFTIVWYVTIFNSVNWSDGLPGLTSGISAITFVIIAFLSIKLLITDPTLPSQANARFALPILAVLLPSVILFWILNYRPRFLLNDSGTMFLAFMIATLAIISWGKVATVASVLGVYLIDFFYVILARLWNRQKPWKGDRVHHLHYRLMKLGLSADFIRWMVYGLSASFWVAAVFLDKTGKIILFVILAIIIFGLTRIIQLKRDSF